MAVGTGGSAARAAVELAIAVAGDGLDVADRGLDLGRDEFERLGDVAPFGDRRDLETRTGTVAPPAGRADQLPGGNDAVPAVHVEELLDGHDLGAGGRFAGAPRLVLRSEEHTCQPQSRMRLTYAV